MRGRRSHAERLACALALLADPVYDALLGERVPFDTMPSAMPRILSGRGLCPVITYGTE